MTGLEGEVTSLAALGADSLIFLAATVFLVPLSKKLNVSPVLGFLGAGLALGPHGFKLIRELRDLNALGELGITFLLFEQGLELSLDRLKALGKYAFGLGTLQVLLCTLAFGAFPFGEQSSVQLMESIFKSPDSLVNISRLDESVVIGAALSLSSSAFVLKILQEKGLLSGRAGQATLGVLLLQDIAVVPLLVLLPIIENQQAGAGDVPLMAQAAVLGGIALKAVGGLGAILVFGRFLLRRLFDGVAATRSTEAFVALCLLVAIGIGEVTDAMGLSASLGAFVAGTLLAETNYRMQVEADIAPFRGLLLALFFMTTGASVDPHMLWEQWPTVLGLLTGLLLVKGIITSTLGPLFGLTKGESVRVGSILSGGGEFAFVVLTLAQKLNVLPLALDKLLVGTVVLSMALTPVLAAAGDKLGDYFDTQAGHSAPGAGFDDETLASPIGPFEGQDLVVICGFGPVGQIVASLISAPAVSGALCGARFVAFDLDPRRVSAARARGYPVFYGDGSQPKVIETAGIADPRALVVTYSDHALALSAVERLRGAYPRAKVFARATDYGQYWRLRREGATAVVSDLSEISIRLGSELLESFGVARTYEIQSAKAELRETLACLSQVRQKKLQS
ncbi:Sodium/hydrogen exchanger family-domain-containing protein [Tribonema minus]|uniref:Sodium/hydrogen exchanger family-domain-containing protein n=1 Tax=Tribonema minus TaxID=303371 RepID=A0A835ZEK7_9STRA|nr:Sodium/hydrogen exchanger family-domain-containing protein [Tribonema minus]